VSGERFAGLVQVGGGRGFLIDAGHRRLVITAAHCLPERCEECGSRVPPAHGASHLEERTYANLLAALGAEPRVWAECLFADPVADIAVLGAPDSEALSDEAEEYDALVEPGEPLAIGCVPDLTDPRGSGTPARLVTLENRLVRCEVSAVGGGPLWIANAREPIRGGMSGSPIISEDGAALGVVCIGTGSEGGPNPRLTHHLPAWLVAEVQRRQS
jgi:hypothetical protein